MGLGLSLGTNLSAAQEVTNPEVKSVLVTGGSVLLNAEFETDPAAVTVSTFALDPTVLTFTKDSGSLLLRMTLVQINDTAVAWDGLMYELEGGIFASAPRLTFGGPPGMVDPNNASEAKLLFSHPSGPPALVDLTLDFAAGTNPVLTVTPLVPEPAAGALLMLTTPLLARRARARG